MFVVLLPICDGKILPKTLHVKKGKICRYGTWSVIPTVNYFREKILFPAVLCDGREINLYVQYNDIQGVRFHSMYMQILCG